MVSPLFLVLITFLLCSLNASQAQQAVAFAPTWDFNFSPRGGATFAIRQSLDNAKSSVFVQAYSFTSASIAEALVGAHRWGVKIRVLPRRGPSDWTKARKQRNTPPPTFAEGITS